MITTLHIVVVIILEMNDRGDLMDNDLVVYSSENSNRRRVSISSINHIWYAKDALCPSSMLFRATDYKDSRVLDGYKEYTLKDICDYANKNNLEVIRNIRILMFKEKEKQK